MTARTTRRTFTLGAVATTAGALALALIPATVANAVGPATPVFSYIDISGGTAADPIRQLAVDDVLGSKGTPTSVPVGTDVTNLTGDKIQTYTYDVAPDGQTMVVAARTGTPTTDAFDSTFGMVVVHAGPTPTSRLVANFWDANPVLSNNGAKVWWMDAGTLYSADTATYVVTAHTTALAPKNDGKKPPLGPNDTETVTRLAVSADGTMAAVMYSGLGTNTTDRVLAVPVDTGKTADGYGEVTYAKQATTLLTLHPDNATFVWRGNDTLIYGESNDADSNVLGVSLAVPAGAHASVVTKQANLDNFYDLRLAADNTTWWLWKDDAGVSPNPDTSKAYSVDDSALFTTAPAPQASDRGNGDSTFRYVPSTVAPPVLNTDPLTTTTSNRAALHPTLAFTASTVKYAAKVAYQSIGLYGGLPGGGYDVKRAAETDKGLLERSSNGVNGWTKVADTSGASVIPIGTKYYNGYTPVLVRNTWFRWTVGGDAFTTQAQVVRKIIVVPNITVKVAKSGTARIVSGTVTRKGGTAVLQRNVPKLGWRTVATKVLPTTGTSSAFNFGKRALVKGSYRVITIADVSWGAGSKAFTI